MDPSHQGGDLSCYEETSLSDIKAKKSLNIDFCGIMLGLTCMRAPVSEVHDAHGVSQVGTNVWLWYCAYYGLGKCLALKKHLSLPAML